MAEIAQLSGRLTEAIHLVELQRSTVEQAILRLFAEAQQLNQVSAALCEAATTQGTVLIDLQQMLQSNNAPTALSQALAPAAQEIAAASEALASSAPAAVPEWRVADGPGPKQGDVVWHDGQKCTVQYVNSKGLLDLRNEGGAVHYGVGKVQLRPVAAGTSAAAAAPATPIPAPLAASPALAPPKTDGQSAGASSCSEGASQPDSPRSEPPAYNSSSLRPRAMTMPSTQPPRVRALTQPAPQPGPQATRPFPLSAEHRAPSPLHPLHTPRTAPRPRRSRAVRAADAPLRR